MVSVGIIGAGPHAEARAEAMRQMDGANLAARMPEALDLFAGDAAPSAEALQEFLAAVDAVLVTVPTAMRYRVAEAAARRGVHVFLEWPPATSLREAEQMAGLAEEAGIEAGVSRPLRFHPVCAIRAEAGRAHLIVLREETAADSPPDWPGHLADALDLCCALAQTAAVQRIDAEAVPGSAAWPEAVAFGLRFHNSTYAQVSLRRRAPRPVHALYVAGKGFQVEADLAGAAVRRWSAERADDEWVPVGCDESALLEAETRAFLDAIAGGQPAPVSVLDGLHTMRLVERLMRKLR